MTKRAAAAGKTAPKAARTKTSRTRRKVDARAKRDREVFAASDAFWAALPALLEDARLLNRWVVFRDGGVQADEETFGAAFERGLALFGPDIGFAVHRVEPREVELLGALGLR